LNKFNVEISRC